MYADDTCVNIASENLNELLTDLKNELENISNWMGINKLSLDTSKSEYMVIGHRRQLNKLGNDLPDFLLDNEVIKRVDKQNTWESTSSNALIGESSTKLSITS